MGDVNMADIYRKSALKKITDPDQLDRAITVSSPMSWLAIIGIAVVFAAVIVWGFLGSIPETLAVNGVVVSGNNIEKVKEITKNDTISGDTAFCYVPSAYMAAVDKAVAESKKNGEAIVKIFTADKKLICEAEIVYKESPVVDLSNKEGSADGLSQNNSFYEKQSVAVVCKPVANQKAGRINAFNNLEDGTPLVVRITTDSVRPVDKLFGGKD